MHVLHTFKKRNTLAVTWILEPHVGRLHTPNGIFNILQGSSQIST